MWCKGSQQPTKYESCSHGSFQKLGVLCVDVKKFQVLNHRADTRDLRLCTLIRGSRSLRESHC